MKDYWQLRATICIVIGVFFAPAECFNLQGASYYSILVGAQGTGSYQFAREFSRLWDVPEFEMLGSLVPIVEKKPENRLRRLRSRQGDFAILPPQEAHRLLAGNPEIVVITALWPNALHVITHQTKITALRVETPDSIYAHHNSAYFVVSWNKLLSLRKYKPSQFQWFAKENILETLSIPDNGTLFVTAPYPLQEIHQLLLNPAYKLIPPEDRLITVNRENYPWLVSRPLPANIYPNSPQPVPTLTSYPVLVARSDTPNTIILQILKILFPSASANHQVSILPHSLFRFLEPQINHLFKKNYHFHSESKKRFKL